MAGQLIYSLEELSEYAKSKDNKIKRAAMAAAFKIRDNARLSFINDAKTKYKHHTGVIDKLAEGIQVGKNNNGIIKIHAYGTKDVYDTYRTRFFVGGTVHREVLSLKDGRRLKKSRYVGRLLELDTLDKELSKSSNILKTYIQHAING